MSERRRRAPVPAVLALVVLVVSGVLAVTVFAATPDQGTVSIDSPRLDQPWEGQEYAVGATITPDACEVPDADSNAVCDTFTLTVDIPKEHWESNRGGVDVRTEPDPESASPGNDDFDIHVYDKDGNPVGEGITAGGGTERAFIPDANSEDGPYRIEVSPYDVSESGYFGGAFVESRAIGDGGDIPTEPVSNVACENGMAGVFPCDGVDLQSFLPTTSITEEGDEPANLNDIWGWTDPETGREYALVGKTNGTSFVDVTDAANPVFLGDLPSFQRAGQEPVETIFNTWRDIKVFDDHAYIVSEEPAHGMQVFDLRRLRGATEPPAGGWDEDAHYSFVVDGPQSLLAPPDVSDRTPLFTLDNAHNVAINEESGHAYAIGTSTCAGGGAHMIDLGDPNGEDDGNPKPTFAGCIADDSYTHDTQCVNYEGPDSEFAGDEICLSSNEDSLTIHKVAEADGTRLDTPELLSRTEYQGSEYTHQGWLTPDSRYFLVGDELDEQADPGIPTKTLIFDVQSLRMVPAPKVHDGRTESIDHNMYTKGDRVFQANYRSGLEILGTSDVANGTLTPEAFFDVYPEDDQPEFNGAWSNYPYFPSGNVVVSGIEQGLFVLRPQSADEGGEEPPVTEEPCETRGKSGKCAKAGKDKPPEGERGRR